MLKQSFNHKKDEVKSILTGIVQGFIGRDYCLEDAQAWTAEISEEVIKEMKGINEGMKFGCVAIVFPRGNASMSIASCCVWDENADSVFQVDIENKTMHIVVTVYALLNKI